MKQAKKKNKKEPDSGQNSHAYYALDFFNRVNYRNLKEQKKTLVKIHFKDSPEKKNMNMNLTRKDLDNLDCILGLIDYLQEVAVDKLKIVKSRTAHFYPKES